MSAIQPLINKMLSDLRVDLTEEFSNNFRRKSFFSTPWPATSGPVRRGSLMARSGSLIQSIRSRIEGNQLIFSSSLPYAEIHNSGGRIKITARMKRFFWAKYYEASGQVRTLKSGARSRSARSEQASDEALFWRAMALKKVGDSITIPQRQFIGESPEVDARKNWVIEKVLNDYFTNYKIPFK